MAGASAVAIAGCGEVVRLGDQPLAPDGAITPPAGTDGGPEAGMCSGDSVPADEVLWIGDSWVTNPGVQHTGVRDLARAAGAIGPNDDYADLAAAGATMAKIAEQYATGESGATKVKVIIMDGGGWDLIESNGAASAVTSAVQAFQQLLAKVAADGTVQSIVYYLVPESAAINVPALRPGMEQACASSTVPCYWVDLQPLWASHPEYSNGMLASDAGAQEVANTIWATMQANCIAQ